MPLARRPGRRHLTLTGAREHNLKDVTLRVPLGTLTVRHRRVRAPASPRWSTTRSTGRSRAPSRPTSRLPGRLRRAHRPRVPQGRAAHRPGADRAHAALQPRHLREGVRRDPQALRRAAPRQDARARRRRLLVQRAGRPLRVVPGRRRSRSSRCTSSRTSTSTCQECEGRRYRPEVLQVDVQGLDISDVLRMTVDEAVDFFAAQPAPRAPAQGAAGGRPRLPAPRPARHDAVGRRGPAAEDRRRAGRARRPATCSTSSTSRPRACTWTTSRSSSRVLNRLVDAGNTVLVVEHHLDVDQVRRLGDRPRPRGRRGGRRDRGRGDARADRPDRRLLHRKVPARGAPPANGKGAAPRA